MAVCLSRGWLSQSPSRPDSKTQKDCTVWVPRSRRTAWLEETGWVSIRLLSVCRRCFCWDSRFLCTMIGARKSRWGYCRCCQCNWGDSTRRFNCDNDYDGIGTIWGVAWLEFGLKAIVLLWLFGSGRTSKQLQKITRWKWSSHQKFMNFHSLCC